MTTDLDFAILDVLPDDYAAAPQITVRLRITEASGEPVHAIALRCQVRLEPQYRRYDDTEAEALRGVFGGRDRWAQTLKPFQWLETSRLVPGFTHDTEVDLSLPCSYDFDVVGSRYLHALGEGDVPLSLLFSGSVFTRGPAGFGVERVPWDREARFGMPVAVWRRTIELHYPGTGWVRLAHDSVAALEEYRAWHGLTSWDETVAHLLAGRAEVTP